ncbi:hypothetical protein FE810_13515 [Thalassotalea litorea]|uniref:Uncharacterized protein n=1 Tax=Thalassotalea litorea TaxID=2020715 RepID=A0A5R9IDZ9_9GAMM|nr:hypothetical protein [Thalassotalea litorea]TLU61831.1 hypothetical protein FE810_13515 [Thalassotalea litorea]
MFSTNRDQTLALLLILAACYFIYTATELIFHTLGILAIALFYLVCLRSLVRIDADAKQCKRSVLPLKSNRYSFHYKTRLLVLTGNLLLLIESIRFFPENLAVAIALFSVILAIREWIALIQWANICQRQIMKY